MREVFFISSMELRGVVLFFIRKCTVHCTLSSHAKFNKTYKIKIGALKALTSKNLSKIMLMLISKIKITYETSGKENNENYEQ